MQKLLAELKTRRIWRVLVAYPGLSFALLQVVEFFVNNYDLDSRYLTATIIAALLLLPAAVVWNWRHGEQGEQAVTGPEVGVYLLSVSVTVAILLWYWRVTPAAVPTVAVDLTPARSVAVMPFENSGGDAEMQYLCDGIAENLINWLATVADVRVVSKTASFRHREQASDTALLAAELGVDSVVRGRLERVGDNIVISASMIDTRDDRQIWGDRLVRQADEVIFLERSIVAAIKDGLRLSVSDAPGELVASSGTDKPDAYQHYLRGHFLIQATDVESIGQGIEELRAAIAADPQYAKPYADIADALSQMLFYGIYSGEKLMGEARNAAYSAVALAPDLAEAHTALGAVHQYFSFDWRAADEAYQTAISLTPQSPTPYHRYADFLWASLRIDRAREIARRALELDPLDGNSMHAVGISALFAGDFTGAAEAFGEWNRYHPGSLWSYIKHAVALSLAGQCDRALQQAEHVERRTGGKMSILAHSWQAWTYHACGRGDLFQRSRDRIETAAAQDPDSLDPGLMYLYALLGDGESLLDLAQRLVDAKSPITMFLQLFGLDYMGWSLIDEFAQDPRYQELISKLEFLPVSGLPD